MLVRLAQGLGKRIIVGSLGLSKSSKKNFYTVSYFFFFIINGETVLLVGLQGKGVGKGIEVLGGCERIRPG